MRRFQRFLVALTAASVAAKTGTTPDPMYELDAVCADWWHTDKSDAPPPTPKPTTTLPKGGKADKDEDESDGSAALSHSLAAAVVALLAA